MNSRLIFTNKYPSFIDDGWLTSDMTDFLSDNKVKSYVFLNNWNGGPCRLYRRNKAIIFSMPSYSERIPFCNMQKWLLSSLTILMVYVRIKKRIKFDYALFFSPLFIFWAVIFYLQLTSVKRRVIYWDFFPEHQIQMGLIGGNFFGGIFKYIEEKLFRGVDFIYLMSPRNIHFFKNYFHTINKNILFELPLWGRAIEKVSLPKSIPLLDLDSECLNIVWGGQLTHGRGLELISNIIECAAMHGLNIKVFIFGGGKLLDRLPLDSPYVQYMGYIPRAEYVSMLSRFSVALIATDPTVNMPVYPSKILDYAAFGLPVIAMVDDSSDFGDFIEFYNAGVVVDSQLSSIYRALLSMMNKDKLSDFRSGSLNLYVDRHSISKVLSQFLKD